MTRPFFPLLASQYRSLVRRDIILICAERCELRAEFISDELCFVMTGPSGRHILSGTSTDLRRLNAHWKGFVTEPTNKLAA